MISPSFTFKVNAAKIQSISKLGITCLLCDSVTYDIVGSVLKPRGVEIVTLPVFNGEASDLTRNLIV